MDEVNTDHNPFAGRWIARIGKQVICQAGSADQVFRAAKSIRAKENLIISYLPLNEIMTFPSIFYKIQTILSKEPEVYLVGGAIRNALLGQPIHDLDFALTGNVEKTARYVSRELDTDFYPLDAERETYRLIAHEAELPDLYLDFCRTRGPNLEADLGLRDFTINAMAVNIHDPQKLIDPLGGAQDLRDKKVRACSQGAIQDDPIRILRAIRFAAEGGYKIEDDTRRLLKEGVGLLIKTSPERIRDELFKIFSLDQLPAALKALDWLHCFPVLIPELSKAINSEDNIADPYRAKTDLSSTTELVALIRSIILRDTTGEAGTLVGGLTASTVGKFRHELKEYLDSRTTLDRNCLQLIQFSNLLLILDLSLEVDNVTLKTITQRLNLAREEFEIISRLTSRWKDIASILESRENIDRLAAYRYFNATGSAGIGLTLLFLARKLTENGKEITPDCLVNLLQRVEYLWDAWWNNYDQVIEPIPILNGEEIMSHLHIPPGPLVGALLDQLKEKQAAGDISSREQAIKLISQLAR